MEIVDTATARKTADQPIFRQPPSPTPAVLTQAAGASYPTVFFITGGGMTDAEQAKLAADIRTYYQSRISMGQMTIMKYTDDCVAIMTAQAPTGPLILAGHSFGGWSAIAVATTFGQRGRVLQSLMLCDPVNSGPNQYLIPQQPVTAPPAAHTLCMYRGATAAPYSTFLTGPGTYANVLVPPSGGGGPEHHPDSVWDAQALAFIAQSVITAPSTPGWKSVTVTDLDGRQWLMMHPVLIA